VDDLLNRAAAPDPPRLTDDEIARLAAHLKTHRRKVSFRAMQSAASGDQAVRARLELEDSRRAALRRTLEYNRLIRVRPSPAWTEPPKQAHEPAGTGQREGDGHCPTNRGPTLDQKDIVVLKALLKLGAVDSESRKTQAKIVESAWGRGADSDSCKRPCAKLKRLGLIDTKEGPGGGSWLTPEGLKRAESG
jgi:hypothetical protein